MKDIDLLLPHVMQYAKGCSDPIAVHHLREAAQRFCESTNSWRAEDEFTVAAGVDGVVVVPQDSTLHALESARFNGTKIDPVSLSWLDDHMPRWREIESSAAKYITQTEFDTVQLVPKAAGTLALVMLLKPSEEAQQLPDFLIDKYATTIAAGALENILLLPRQPFTNPALAGVFAQRFKDATGRRFAIGLKGQQRAPIRVKAQFF